MRKNVCYYCKNDIEQEKDDFIRASIGKSMKYFHTECFRKRHLNAKTKKLKLSEKEVEELIIKYKEETVKLLQLKEQRESLYDYLKFFYDASISDYLFLKIEELVKGENNRYLQISYAELKDIYKNLEIYLEKNAQNKEFNSVDQRMYYDFVVVCNNINKYLSWKAKEEKKNAYLTETSNVEIQINDMKNIKKRNINSQNDILDIIDDVFNI